MSTKLKHIKYHISKLEVNLALHNKYIEIVHNYNHKYLGREDNQGLNNLHTASC